MMKDNSARKNKQIARKFFRVVNSNRVPDELKLQIIERYDEPADSTAHEIMKMIFGSEKGGFWRKLF